MKKRSVFERIAASPYIFWSVLFIIAPLLFVIYFAFTTPDGGFTWMNITSLPSYSHTFLMSIGFSLIATVVCFLIGYPLAYCMSQMNGRARNILMTLIMLPMWISLLIRTYSLMALLDNGGLVSSFLTSLGFERLILFVTGMQNIRDVIPFPRTPKNAEF
jgi:spermidine/putrescine transport system permease protein